MPNAAAALLALTLHRPITDSGVWLENAPVPGSVVTAPLRVEGETQAPEGVLHVRLYVVSGTSATEVASYEPLLPGVGTVPFAFTWTPARPGTYTVRVVSTTAVRGFSAEVRDLRVPAKPALARPAPAPRAVARLAVAPKVAPRPAVRRVTARLDDSGRAFGRSAPTLPYTRPPVVRSTTVVPAVAATRDSAVPAGDRSGWVSFAGGLLLLLVCSHLHRSLRPQPDPRGTS